MNVMTKEMGRNIGEAMKLFALPAETAKAAVYKLEGQPFFSTVRHHGVDALWNVVALPPRLVWDLIKGMARGTLALSWAAIKHLPIPVPMLDSWKGERDQVAMRTQDALRLFRFDQQLPPLFTGHHQATPALSA